MRNLIYTLAVCAAVPASAGTLRPYDNLYVFGDSLSDSGNLAIAAPQFAPNPPYPSGQFTNGNAWTTQLGLAPSLAGGTNYAFGGARAADNGDFIPDITAQIGSFIANGGPQGTAAAVIWAGGNDFRDFSDIEEPTKKDLRALIRDIRKNVNRGIRTLAKAGVDDIIVFGMPDFGKLPEFAGDAAGSEMATNVTDRVNGKLQRSALRKDRKLADVDVRYFDVNEVLNEWIAGDPTRNVQFPCLVDPECFEKSYQYVFFDDIHPVVGVHTLLADTIKREYLSEVPLPAGGMLLLSGLAGFGVWARRRKSQA